MRQFDILENPNPATRQTVPYLVVLQSHHLDPLATVLLAPVIRAPGKPVDLLHVELAVDGEQLPIAIPEAAGVPRPPRVRIVGSARGQEDAIRRAFQRLLTGF